MSDGDGQVEGLEQEVGLSRLRTLARLMGVPAAAEGVSVDMSRIEYMLAGREVLDQRVLDKLASISGMFVGSIDEEGDGAGSLAPGLGGGMSRGTGVVTQGGDVVSDGDVDWLGESLLPVEHEPVTAGVGPADAVDVGDGMSVVLTAPGPDPRSAVGFGGDWEEEVDADEDGGEDGREWDEADGEEASDEEGEASEEEESPGEDVVIAARGGDLEPVVGVDLTGDGRADLPLVGVGLVRPGVSWTEEIEQKRMALRSARALALMSQFPVGRSYQRHVASVGLVTQIELALISFYHEAVPDPSVVWDGEKRGKEIDRRLCRLRWVEREQHREYGGFKGVWNRLVGRRKISGVDLYEEMVKEVDRLVKAIEGGNKGGDLMNELMLFSGVDSFGQLNPG